MAFIGCTYLCVHMGVRPEVNTGCVSHSLSTLFLTEGLSKPGPHLTRLAAHELQGTCLHPSAPCLQCMLLFLVVYVGSGVSNSGPHAGTEAPGQTLSLRISFSCSYYPVTVLPPCLEVNTASPALLPRRSTATNSAFEMYRE